MQSLVLPSPAKLNLFLHILGRRDDGYHNIQTVFQFIDLCDELTFYCRQDKKICLMPDLMGLPAQKNLIMRAANLLREKTNCQLGADITYAKHIPMGAGLGGGSSNAATTLLALNQLWNINMPMSELAKLGEQLGADVPVFVHGHAAWAEGIGTDLTPIILPQPWYLLVIPGCHISSAELYNHEDLERDSAPLRISNYRIGQGQNDFESVACNEYPKVAEALDWLSEYAPSRMTGSGSVVFAAFDTQEEASKIAALVPVAMQGIVAKGLNRSPLQAAMAQSLGSRSAK